MWEGAVDLHSTAETYTAAVRDYPHTTAVKTGELVPARCRLEFVDVEPIHKAFAPMVRELRFDFCELALATCLQAREAGKQISLLPIVLHGNFHHGSISRLAGGLVLHPKDLAGTRVGVRSYPQTTALWVRGILADDYGVDPDEITWVTTEAPHVAEYVEPANVERTTGSLLGGLHSGDTAAVLIGPRAIPEGAPLEPLIEDWQQAQQAWHDRHATVPINHLLAVRTDVLRTDPDAVRSVYDAFAASMDAATGARSGRGARRVAHGLTEGVRESLRLAIRYAASQHLITTQPEVDDLFSEYYRYLEQR